MACKDVSSNLASRNASENPAGIETESYRRNTRSIVATHQKTQQGLKLIKQSGEHQSIICRNASENPAGIETMISRLMTRLV